MTARNKDSEDDLSKLWLQEKLKYEEFINDAIKCPRLTPWEVSFISDLAKALFRGIITTHEELSERQLGVIKQIEKKVYSIG